MKGILSLGHHILMEMIITIVTGAKKMEKGPGLPTIVVEGNKLPKPEGK